MVGFGLLALSLSACSRETKDITQILKEGVVKVTYGKRLNPIPTKSGHATGFFVEGNRGRCTVLTVAHAVPEDADIRITPYDSERVEVTQIQRASGDDLAVMTFDVEDAEQCPYTSLKLGDSDRLRIDDFVRMAGYPERAGAARLVLQFPSGRVTKIESPPLPNGYAISYDMTTVGGMSGAPVVNEKGRVVGVHGLTDSELVSLGRAQQSSLSDTQEDEIEEAEERVEGLARINHFKWGIPIQTFVRQQGALVMKESLLSISNKAELAEIETQEKEVSELIEEADRLRNKKEYKESIDLYDEALAIDSQQKEGWFGKGFLLVELERYEEAITAYDKALEIDPDYAFAWNNRGLSLEKLNRNDDALKSYEKAIEADPNNTKAVNNLKNLKNRLN